MAQISKVICDLRCGNSNASFYCYECKQNLCVSCRAFHDQIPVTKNHAVTDLNQVDFNFLSQINCKKHNSAYIVFCKTCNNLICDDCVISEHKDHEYIEIDEIAKDVRNSVNKMLTHGESKLDEVVTILSDINTTFHDTIEIEGKKQISKIETAATSFKSIIDLGQNLLADKVKTHMQIEKEDLRMTIRTLQNLKRELETSCQSLRQFLNVTHNTSFVAAFPVYKSMIAQQDDIPQVQPPEKIDEFNVREFLDKIIANVCERFRCDIFDRKDREIQTLRHTLQEKLEQIHLLESKIEKTEAESKSDSDKIRKKDEKIEQLQDVIKQVERQNIREKKKTEESEKKIEELENMLHGISLKKTDENVTGVSGITGNHETSHQILKWVRCSKSAKQNKLDVLPDSTIKEIEEGLRRKLPNVKVKEGSHIYVYQLDSYEYYVIGQDNTCSGIFYKTEESGAKQKVSRSQTTFPVSSNIQELVVGKQKQGRRHGRIIASEQNYKKDNEQGVSEDFGTKLTFARSVFGLNSPVSSNSPDELTFFTKEGLVVRVYVASIIQLKVDCIVNAANENLSHGGGVADVISRAAGYRLQDECDDYIRNHGPLNVAECVTTAAYNLPYKCIIHAVGPKWYDYPNDKKQCGLDLKKTIKNCLHKADGINMETIAIPALSSGIFGVPKEVCVWHYRQAVADYSAAHGHKTSLKEIHFMDKDSGMIRLIQEEFKTRLNV